MGDAEIIGCNGRRQLEQGEAVTINDRIVTGAEGRVRIEFDDRDDEAKTGPSVMNIGPNSEVLIESFKTDDKRNIYELVRGAIRWFMKGSGGRTDSYSVRAGVAVCGMRGTDVIIMFSPNLSANLTFALVREGTMTMTGPNNQVDLKPGKLGSLGFRKDLEIVAEPLPNGMWEEQLESIDIPLPQ
jgi:hypothetical protein